MNKDFSSLVLAEQKNKTMPSKIYSLPHYGIPHPGLHPHTPGPTIRQRRQKVVLRSSIEAIELVILALIMFICIRSVVQNYVVMGDSMQPNFESGQFLVVNNKLLVKINTLEFLIFSDFAWDIPQKISPGAQTRPKNRRPTKCMKNELILGVIFWHLL